MDFLISLLCGLVGYGVALFALFKAFKTADRIDTFICSRLKMPWLAEQLWWFFPVLCLIVAVHLVQSIVTFIDPSITF
jgi:hypothetical protein